MAGFCLSVFASALFPSLYVYHLNNLKPQESCRLFALQHRVVPLSWQHTSSEFYQCLDRPAISALRSLLTSSARRLASTSIITSSDSPPSIATSWRLTSLAKCANSENDIQPSRGFPSYLPKRVSASFLRVSHMWVRCLPLQWYRVLHDAPLRVQRHAHAWRD